MNFIRKIHFSIAFLGLININCFAQVTSGDVSFVNTINSPLEYIANQFYENVQGLDTCCLTALGSAKFTIHNNGKIDNIMVSVGIPIYIASYLKEAIYSSARYWKIDKGYKSVSVIIPLLIAPSSLCNRENIKDDILTSSANIFTYEGGYKVVKRYDYFKKAEGIANGLILSPLLIKGKITDVFQNNK